MDNLRNIESFIKAVQAGSIAAGARLQGITPAAASQNIQRLEKSLGTRLLVRTTRSLAMTESGELYYAEVSTITERLKKAHASITEFQDLPRGRLRIASSVAFGRHVLAPIIPAFERLYPNVSIELILADRNVDHVKEDIDISIRFRQQLELGLVARKITRVPVLFCASPDYVALKGKPEHPRDLLQHDCLMFRMPMDGRLLSWEFIENGVRFAPDIKPSIVCNDIDALANLAVSGAGIARLGAFVAPEHIRNGRLIALFQDSATKQLNRLQSEPLEFYACFRDQHALTKKVRRFVDYLATAISADWPGS